MAPVPVDVRSQRGATLVQYVLVIVLLALVIVTAATRVGTGSKDTFHTAGSGVHTEGASSGSGGSSAAGGAGDSGGTGGGSEGHPATTLATTPATTAPQTTTTTTAPTTTTTAPPTTTTTTTAAPKSASVSFVSTQGIADSTSRWHARTQVLVRGSGSEAVQGAQVELLIEGWSSSGGGGTKRTTQTVTVATDLTGQVVVDTNTVARSGTSRVNSITIRVQDVSVPDGFVWGGATPSTSVNRV